MNTQVHVIYTGRVQGVGFRYTVREIAQRMRVTGTVRNVPDGSVELNAQADEQLLRGFLDEVHAHFSRYIRDTSVAWLPVNVRFEDFEIIF